MTHQAEGEGDKGGEVEMTKQRTIVEELETFLEELRHYYYYRNEMQKRSFTAKKLEEVANLRRLLVRKSGKYKNLIAEITGIKNVSIFLNNKEYQTDIWSVGLLANAVKRTPIALGYCIDSVGQAIGKLEDDIKNGIRDKKTGLLKPATTVELPPKAFISQGKASAALNKLKEFLETLGIEPLIVKKQPSLDKDLPDKVDLYLSQADFVIILATADDKVEDKLQPRQNVIHEIGLAQKTRPGKIIYLLEEGAEFPSNIRPKVWESFKQRNMMNAFLGIVRELRAYGMLKVTKYPI